MGRQSSYDEGEVFAAVARALAVDGRFTLEGLTVASGLSMGSIYHRFGSREGLLAEAWLAAVERFQAGFLEALEPGTLEAGVNAALATPRFCRTHAGAAVLLACCRQSEFLQTATPKPLRARIETVNAAVARAVRRYASAIDRPLIACRLALIAYPLGAVRLYLPVRPVPKELDVELARAARTALGRTSRG